MREDVARARLREYQRPDTFEILKVILECFPSPRTIEVLEVGCGIEVTEYLSGWVGSIVGINLVEKRPSAGSRPNLRMQVMDATQLSFPDQSFDFVFSANVNEHIGDLARALSEQVRVLRRGGYGYARWNPVWSGPRGHHIHADMVETWEHELALPASGYQNDGTVIEDWSHLLLSESELRKRLEGRLSSARLAERILWTIYKSAELNRLFIDDVERVFASTGSLQVVSWETGRVEPPSHTLALLQRRHGVRDFSVASCQVLFTRA